MATGDQNDILNRLQTLMPTGWFPKGLVPIRDAVLTGIANMFAWIYSLLGYVKLQTRILTATDGFLDLIAFDFFGDNLIRRAGQSDTSFRANIIAFLFRQRVTRQSIVLVIQQLLGTTPLIIEPDNPNDTGVWGVSGNGTIGYGVAGVYGSMSQPFQPFVTVFQHVGSLNAPPLVAGYGVSVGGYSTPSQIEYIAASQQRPVLSPADIYAALDSVRPVCGVIWTKIVSIP